MIASSPGERGLDPAGNGDIAFGALAQTTIIALPNFLIAHILHQRLYINVVLTPKKSATDLLGAKGA